MKNIYDPPAVIFAKGKLELLNSKGIAIVGSRRADEYGLKVSYSFAQELAMRGLTIISRIS